MIRRSGIMIVYPELSANKRILHIEKSNYTCQYNNTLNVIKHTIRDNSKSIIDELSTRTQRILFVKYYTAYIYFFPDDVKYLTKIYMP